MAKVMAIAIAAVKRLLPNRTWPKPSQAKYSCGQVMHTRTGTRSADHSRLSPEAFMHAQRVNNNSHW
jgi:hypothetical protein